MSPTHPLQAVCITVQKVAQAIWKYHHPLPHCRLHPLHTCFIHLRPAKHQPLPPLRHHPVQYAQMQMHVCVQRRAKTVHKQHPAAAACRRRACARSRWPTCTRTTRGSISASRPATSCSTRGPRFELRTEFSLPAPSPQESATAHSGCSSARHHSEHSQHPYAPSGNRTPRHAWSVGGESYQGYV